MPRNDPDDTRSGLPRNYLRAGLLLLISEKPSHGYDLLERFEEFGPQILDPGGLYRALRALERDGFVESSWEHSHAGPARRVYEITAAGLGWLDTWADTLRESHRFLASYLARYDGSAPRRRRKAKTLTTRAGAADG